MGWGKRGAGYALVVLVTFAHGVQPAQADDLDKGVELYEALDYEKAQAKLEAALSAPDAPAEKVARASLYLGLVRFHLGDTTGAEAYFGIALAYDDSTRLPEGTSPKISESFDKIKTLKFPASGGPPPVKAAPSVAVETPANPPPAAATASARSRSGPPWWTILAGATTVVAGGVASTYAVQSFLTKRDIEGDVHTRNDVTDLQDRLGRQSRRANIWFAVTGALAASTLLVYVVERRADSALERAPAAGPSAVPDRASKPSKKQKSSLNVSAFLAGDTAWIGAGWEF